MRLGVSAATMKRLEALEQTKGTNRPIALFPRLMQVDEWESTAAPAQKILKQNVKSHNPPTITA